jgi:phosphate-selective porin OprO/OprP
MRAKILHLLIGLVALILTVPTHSLAKEEVKVEAGGKNEESQEKSKIRLILEEIRMEQEKQTDKQKQVRTLYDEGFTLLGEDDTLKIGVWMQNDVRVFFNNHPSRTQFLVRRARLDFRGSLEKIFGFRLMGEFEGDGGTNAANLKEGWVEYNQFPVFRIKVGQFKEPYGLENLYSDLWLDFLERPVAENFIRPEQDLGLMFFGKLFGKRLEYGVGIFNGSGTNIAESNDDKDAAGRLALTPFAGRENKWVKHLTFGGSMTYGKQSSTLDNTGPTTAGGTRFLTFVNPTAVNDVTVNDFRTRAGGDIEWLVGPFSLKGEYVFSRIRNVAFGGINRQWDLHGFSGQATYLLTGETKTNQGPVLPKRPFNPVDGRWGAVELAARFEALRSDQGLIDAGFAAGTDDLWSVTGGLNWYLNRHIRTSTNYVFTKFDDAVATAGGKASEHALLFRFQFNL